MGYLAAGAKEKKKKGKKRKKKKAKHMFIRGKTRAAKSI